MYYFLQRKKASEVGGSEPNKRGHLVFEVVISPR